MKKIRLNLDALKVETFTTTRNYAREGGTVRGHDSAPGSGIGCLTQGCGSDSGWEACACEDQLASARPFGGCTGG